MYPRRRGGVSQKSTLRATGATLITRRVLSKNKPGNRPRQQVGRDRRTNGRFRDTAAQPHRSETPGPPSTDRDRMYRSVNGPARNGTSGRYPSWGGLHYLLRPRWCGAARDGGVRLRTAGPHEPIPGSGRRTVTTRQRGDTMLLLSFLAPPDTPPLSSSYPLCWPVALLRWPSDEAIVPGQREGLRPPRHGCAARSATTTPWRASATSSWCCWTRWPAGWRRR